MEKLSDERLNQFILIHESGFISNDVKNFSIDEKLSIGLELKQLRAKKDAVIFLANCLEAAFRILLNSLKPTDYPYPASMVSFLESLKEDLKETCDCTEFSP